jgi:iron complex outermembrane receptor protein
MEYRLFLTTSVAALLSCGAAQAQQTQVPSTAEPVQTAPAGQIDKPVQNAAPVGAVSEVVVTAERRATNLQRTAIAAEVLSGADLEKKGIFNVDQLQFNTPSMTVQNFGQGNDFDIRGIGKADTSSAVGVGVITYRDGVASFPGYFQDEPFYDLASVQVLRGPQGTFAGQNATAGAVFITEADPNFNYHGNLQVQYGNYNDVQIRGAVNLPITDTLAARVAFNDEYHDSFYTVTGDHTGDPGLLKESNARFSLLWDPIPALKVLFKTDYSYIDQGGYAADPALSTTDIFHITNNAHNLAIDQFVRSVLNVSYTLDNGITLRSISGYQQGRTAEEVDADGTNLAPITFEDHVNERVYSEEVNIISPEQGFFTWIVGGYYQHDTLRFPDQGGYDIGEPTGVYDETIVGVNPTQTEAGFGQVSFNLPRGFQVQVGARYTQSSQSVTGAVAIPEEGVSLPDDQKESDSKVTGKLALNWTVDRNNFLYAFVATGHKSGGLNTPSTLAIPQQFKPEDVTDFEVGWKATSFGGHVKTQLGAYYNRYKDFQVSIGNPINPASSLVLNAPSESTIYGVEAQAQAVFGALSGDFSGSYLHSDLGSFYAVDPRLGGTTSSCNTSSGPLGGGCDALGGNEQPYAPTWTVNGGVQYVFHLGQGDLTPRVNFGHVGPQWATLFENAALGDRLAARNILGAQVGYQTGQWLLTAYSTNLNDQHYTSAINAGLRYAGAPRQYGVRLSRDF